MDKSHKVMWFGVFVFLIGLFLFFQSLFFMEIGPGTAAHCWDLDVAMRHNLMESYNFYGEEGGHISLGCFENENFEEEDLDIREFSMGNNMEKEILLECDVKSPEVACSPYRLQIGENYEDFEFSYRTEEDKLYIKVKEVERKVGIELKNFHITLFLMVMGFGIMLYGSYIGKKINSK